jgi:vacuolar protein sorting-associated protein 45
MSKVIVFNFGGVTYEEAKNCNQLSKNLNNIPIIVGGTYIHNSKTYVININI